MTSTKKPHDSSSKGRVHIDELLDEALTETFPASDPVAINIERNLDDLKIVTSMLSFARLVDAGRAAHKSDGERCERASLQSSELAVHS